MKSIWKGYLPDMETQLKPFKVTYSEAFVQELTTITDYIAFVLTSPESAVRFYNKVLGAIQKRCVFPTATQKYVGENITETYYAIYVDKYVVYYKVDEDTIDVRHIYYKGHDANVFYIRENEEIITSTESN